MFFIKSKNKFYRFSDDSKIIINSNFEELPSTTSDVVVGMIPIASGVSTGKKVYRILRRQDVSPGLSGLAGVGAGLWNSAGVLGILPPVVNAAIGVAEKEDIKSAKSKKKKK